MKLDPPRNANYCATVVRVKLLKPVAGLDNLVASPFFGYQALVGKDTKVGDLGILFTAETQLSEEYARINNLHRHGNLNHDENVKGYLEDNRRIKAIKFRGNQSDALLMPLESLNYISVLGPKILDLEEGDTFDFLDGHEICRKYERRTRGGIPGIKAPKVSRVDRLFLPEHFDTENYFKNGHRLNGGDIVTVTQKLHGTSVRVGHTLVKRKLSWLERVAKRFGVKVQEFEYDYVFGSRKVIKDPNNPFNTGFYGEDLWTREGEKLRGLLPRGFVVYGEIVGWTDNYAPIQKGYTYGLPEGTRQLYIYRIAYINPDGYARDLPWSEVKEFCVDNGLKHVPEILTHRHDSFDVNHLLDENLYDLFGGEVDLLPVGPGMVDEGVCIRRDGARPLILKAKSPAFLQWETKQLDKEVVDIEETGEVDG